MNSLKSKNNAKFLLQYHIILVCKYRQKLFVNTEIKNFIIEKFNQVSKEKDFKIILMETDKDHIHLLVESIPQVSCTQIVKCLKQESTFSIWKEKEILMKKYFWSKRTFWTGGYFVSTIGNVSELTLKKYIENQG